MDLANGVMLAYCLKPMLMVSVLSVYSIYIHNATLFEAYVRSYMFSCLSSFYPSSVVNVRRNPIVSTPQYVHPIVAHHGRVPMMAWCPLCHVVFHDILSCAGISTSRVPEPGFMFTVQTSGSRVGRQPMSKSKVEALNLRYRLGVQSSSHA